MIGEIGDIMKITPLVGYALQVLQIDLECFFFVYQFCEGNVQR